MDIELQAPYRFLDSRANWCSAAMRISRKVSTSWATTSQVRDSAYPISVWRLHGFWSASSNPSPIDCLSCSTSTPNSGDTITSGEPQTRVATTGVPQAIDSSKTFAHPSRELARQLTSAALYQYLSSAFGLLPTRITRSSTFFLRTSTMSLARDSPSPTI